MQHFYIGVDGGATKTTIRIEDEAGMLIGQTITGPANIRISVPDSWQMIMRGVYEIFSAKKIPWDNEKIRLHAGMGLAGCEVLNAKEAFLAAPHIFHTLKVTSDAHIACLGAHAGEDGAIIIIGTGVVGFKSQHNKILKTGGWGFPHDDAGGGAWIGLEAAKITTQAHDGRLPNNAIEKEVLNKFGNQFAEFVSWANAANSTAFAELAPAVIKQLATNDPLAINIMQQAAVAIARIFEALKIPDSLPISLVGGLAKFVAPFLAVNIQSRLRVPKLAPDAGAILFLKNSYNCSTEDSLCL